MLTTHSPAHLREKLLRFLQSRAGEVLSPHEIIPAVWGPHQSTISSRNLKAQVYLLREELRETGMESYLQLRHGLGYAWIPPGSNGSERGLDESSQRLLLNFAGRERDVFAFLLARPGMNVPSERLLTDLLKFGYGARSGVLKTYICHIRNKLRPLGLDKNLQTVWGFGYVWVPPVKS